MKVRDKGFSLIELLVVMAILTIFMALAGPAINTVTRGTSITRAGQMVGDVLSWCRQEASTRNRRTEARFYKMPSHSGAATWSAVRAWAYAPSGDALPISPLRRLPTPAVVADTVELSPLLVGAPLISGTETLPTGELCDYVGIEFLPSGRPNDAINQNNFLTITETSQPPSLPANYCIIQIDPITGRVCNFRP